MIDDGDDDDSKYDVNHNVRTETLNLKIAKFAI